MPLRRSQGNMYNWVTHVWSPIVGCPHQCSYCYVRAYGDQPLVPELRDDFPKLDGRWKNDNGDWVREKMIFVGHLCDMFADQVPDKMIRSVLQHCRRFPDNTYVFQTKNPVRLTDYSNELPPLKLVGTTVETNRGQILKKISLAPNAFERSLWLRYLKDTDGYDTFITVEPILDFDVIVFATLIENTKPNFVNIGADSKGHGLPEPSGEKVRALIAELGCRGVKIRKKVNLERLMKV